MLNINPVELTHESLGSLIKEEREAKELTLLQASVKTDIPIDVIMNIEAGVEGVKAVIFNSYCNRIGISITIGSSGKRLSMTIEDVIFLSNRAMGFDYIPYDYMTDMNGNSIIDNNLYYIKK